MRRLGAVVACVVIAGWFGYAHLASQAQGAPAKATEYPKPRYPGMRKVPQTVEELMPYARRAARAKTNALRFGFGILNPGETVMLVGGILSQPNCVEAVKRALEERKVKVLISYDYDYVGVTRAEAQALYDAIDRSSTTEQGYLEAANWVRTTFPDGVGMKWLAQQRPDLAAMLWPKKTTPSAALMNTFNKLRGRSGDYGPGPVRTALIAYLQKHPEVRGLFYGKGGPIWMGMGPVQERWLGIFSQDEPTGLIDDTAAYPADVWMLTEEQSMEPMAFVDRVHVFDPEGTDASWDMSVEQAQKWAKGVYLRGHLFMFPEEAYGQYALSVVNFPAYQKEWISPEPMVLMNGTVAGTNGHGGFYPRIEEHFKDGYLVDVKGGGYYGETLRVMMKYPRIHEMVWPYFKHPGYFHQFETALGTNPKIIRAPLDKFGGTSPERIRSGVYHWGLGKNVWNDPGSLGKSGMSDVTFEWGRKNKMPTSHSFHIHNYFATLRLHLRNTQKWIDITDKGRLAAADNPEVRALASRYGDADDILRDEWIPEIPGINVPGNYERDYAPDPYKYSKSVQDQVNAGTYKYLAPYMALGGRATTH